MRRKNALDSSKLIQVSSKNSVIDVYVDAFPIERVKFRIADYGTPQTSIDIFMEFSDFLKVAHDCRTGELFNIVRNSKQPVVITRGGSPAERANRPDHKAESRILSLGMLNDKIYFNASVGPGNATETGLIMPAGPADKKVSAMTTIGDCKKLIFYTEAAINAYLPTIVNKLVEASEKTRQEFLKNSNQPKPVQNTPYNNQPQPQPQPQTQYQPKYDPQASAYYNQPNNQPPQYGANQNSQGSYYDNGFGGNMSPLV